MAVTTCRLTRSNYPSPRKWESYIDSQDTDAWCAVGDYDRDVRGQMPNKTLPHQLPKAPVLPIVFGLSPFLSTSLKIFRTLLEQLNGYKTPSASRSVVYPYRPSHLIAKPIHCTTRQVISVKPNPCASS